jgi:hypothetical protein
VAPLAVVAVCVAPVTGFIAFILTFFGFGFQVQDGMTGVAVAVCLLGAGLSAGGLALGAVALRQVETRPDTGGRALAAGGATAGLVGTLWALTVALVVVCKAFQG